MDKQYSTDTSGMNNHQHYDLCVVGAGLVGSAIARHASAVPGVKVCLIGPQEPKNKRNIKGDEVFGAHYDSARLTRNADDDPVYATLAERSMQRYTELETITGVKFYHPVGFLFVKNRADTARKHGTHIGTHQSMEQIKKQYPFMKISAEDSFAYESFGGWIDPRKHLSAQITVALSNGCDVLRDVVSHVTKHDQSGGMLIRTEGGIDIRAKRVVLATNSFTTCRHLLPERCSPKFEASPQTVVLGEIDEACAKRVGNMPSMIYRGKGVEGWYRQYPRNSSGMVRFYLLPPVQYPDGRYYIKIGHSDDILKGYLDKKDISKWHTTDGDPWLVGHLTELLKSMFKGIDFLSFRGDSCVTMVTATNRPYIDKIHERLGVAIGGNGHVGKSADEIGRIAACMMLGKDPESDIPMNTFQFVNENVDIKSHL